MRPQHLRILLCILSLLLLLAGCESEPPAAVRSAVDTSELEKVRAADISILFIGNSHTHQHYLPNLVRKLIQFRRPEKTVYVQSLLVPFLDVAARDPRCREVIETRPWKFVVLQAQRISASGRYKYSRTEGIDLAKLAKAHGATVCFFAEWGLKGVAGDGARVEKIYTEMADAAGARVAPVGHAWDLALAQQPNLNLYEADGNHETALGAFLTACVFAGQLTEESPAPLAAFADSAGSQADRTLLAKAAAKSLEERAKAINN